MGHLLSKIRINSKRKSVTSVAIKEYSWDKIPSKSSDDFLIQKLENCEKLKIPGSINGEQIIIQNCAVSTIFILDYTDTVTLDDCIECKIILGPVKRSIFIRDCRNCTIAVACEQFRIRDCSNLNVALFCATQPIIESSNNIQFACYQLHYQCIDKHFQECNLNIWNNTWYTIHDYTPLSGNENRNWSYWNVDMSTLPTPSESGYYLSFDSLNSVTPITHGKFLKNHTECDNNCLVVFCDDYSARKFLNLITASHMNIILIRSRQMNVTNQDAESLFLTTNLINAVQHGPIIGLHMYGKDALNFCSQIIQQLETTLYYVSPTTNIASHQVNTFFGFIDFNNI